MTYKFLRTAQQGTARPQLVCSAAEDFSGIGDLDAGFAAMTKAAQSEEPLPPMGDNTPGDDAPPAEPGAHEEENPYKTEGKERKKVLKALAASKLDMTKEVAKPNFHYKAGGVEFCTSESINVITGQAKQGKSQFLNILAAVAMSGHEFGTLQRAEGTTANNIVWIDTEQSLYNVYANALRLYNIAGIKPGTDSTERGLHIFALRPFKPSERVKLINAAIEEINPDFIVIDGIRDLLNDFNDIDESNQLMTWLLRLSSKLHEAVIFTVIHTNNGTDKMRGHLGTELYNKCSDRFDVIKEGDHFKVKHTSRNDEAANIYFKFDDAGQLAPYTVASKPSAEDQLVENVDEILNRIYAALPSAVKGLPFAGLLRSFAKEAALTQVKAKPILISHIQQGKIVKRKSLFFLAN